MRLTRASSAHAPIALVFSRLVLSKETIAMIFQDRLTRRERPDTFRHIALRDCGGSVAILAHAYLGCWVMSSLDSSRQRAEFPSQVATCKPARESAREGHSPRPAEHAAQ
jgi:hypothetical protein